MAKVLVTNTYLTNIANAIRSKNGLTTTYTPPQMAQAISNLVTLNDVDAVTYYTGSTAPTTGLGNNGDIYLQTV